MKFLKRTTKKPATESAKTSGPSTVSPSSRLNLKNLSKHKKILIAALALLLIGGALYWYKNNPDNKLDDSGLEITRGTRIQLEEGNCGEAELKQVKEARNKASGYEAEAKALETVNNCLALRFTAFDEQIAVLTELAELHKANNNSEAEAEIRTLIETLQQTRDDIKANESQPKPTEQELQSRQDPDIQAN